MPQIQVSQVQPFKFRCRFETTVADVPSGHEFCVFELPRCKACPKALHHVRTVESSEAPHEVGGVARMGCARFLPQAIVFRSNQVSYGETRPCPSMASRTYLNHLRKTLRDEQGCPATPEPAWFPHGEGLGLESRDCRTMRKCHVHLADAWQSQTGYT